MLQVWGPHSEDQALHLEVGLLRPGHACSSCWRRPSYIQTRECEPGGSDCPGPGTARQETTVTPGGAKCGSFSVFYALHCAF